MTLEAASLRIAPSEHAIVTVARALVTGTTAIATVLPILAAPHALPAAVGHSCAALVEDALRQSWTALAVRGGARPQRYLRDGRLEAGRLWERHPAPPALEFTAASLELLRWLVASPLATTARRPPPLTVPAAVDARPLALGDQLVVYFALAALAGPEVPPVMLRHLASQPLVRAAPLAWLGFAADLADAGESSGAPAVAGPPGELPSFAPLATGTGAVIVAALAGELAQRWAAAELAKRAAVRPEAVIRVGAAQDAVLARMLAACHAARRRDLAGFVLEAAAPTLRRGLPSAPLALDPSSPLGLRAQARVASGSLLRAIGHWAAWDQEHRGVRFFEAEYAEAQHLLAAFEPIGPIGAARAAAWLHDLASLGTLAGS